MATDVQFICSENFNAPSLGNAHGALIGVLDVLVNGLLLPPLASASANGTQVTLQFSQNHLLKMFQMIELFSFSPNEINKAYRIIGIPNESTIVIDCDVVNIESVGNAKLKSFGYEKKYTGLNKAVYRNADESEQYRPFLRVDNSLDPVYLDSYAKYAKVGVLDSCSSIDDVSGMQIPHDPDLPAKNWVGVGSSTTAYNGWAKWYYARNSNAYSGSADSASPTNGNRKWMIVGDNKGFYLTNTLTPTESDAHKMTYGFGVYEPIDDLNILPYFLLATWDYATVGAVRDFSSSIPNTAPLYANIHNTLLFGGDNKHLMALPAHNQYTSGKYDDYTNVFACKPYVMLSGGDKGMLVGELPHIRYLSKLRSDKPYSTMVYSDTMYMVDNGINDAKYVFNLGGI